MSFHSLVNCPKCSEVILKSMHGQVKLRAKVAVFEDGECLAVCKGCNTEVAVPLMLDHESISKSMTEAKAPAVRLYINPEFLNKKT